MNKIKLLFVFVAMALAAPAFAAIDTIAVDVGIFGIPDDADWRCAF